MTHAVEPPPGPPRPSTTGCRDGVPRRRVGRRAGVLPARSRLSDAVDAALAAMAAHSDQIINSNLDDLALLVAATDGRVDVVPDPKVKHRPGDIHYCQMPDPGFVLGHRPDLRFRHENSEMTIGQLAYESGVPAATVRPFQNRGMLPPSRPDRLLQLRTPRPPAADRPPAGTGVLQWLHREDP